MFSQEQCVEIAPEHCLLRIQAHVQKYVQDQAFTWFRYLAGLVTILIALIGVTGYQGLKSIMLEKFAEPMVHNTLTNVASDQAKTIIKDQIKPQLEWVGREIHKSHDYLTQREQAFTDKYNILTEKVEKDIETIRLDTETRSNEFLTYIAKTEQDLNTKYKTVTELLEGLRERDRLMSLADKAIAQGDTRAYQELDHYESKELDLTLAANAQVLLIKSSYLSGTRVGGVSLKYPDAEGKEVPEQGITTDRILAGAQESPDFRIRARAVQILRNRNEPQVPEILLRIAETDKHLEVRKCALDSFAGLTHFEKRDVFEWENA